MGSQSKRPATTDSNRSVWYNVRVPLFTLPLTFLITAAGSYLLLDYKRANEVKPAAMVAALPDDGGCDMEQVRIKNYKLIQPLVITDVQSESDELQPLKDQIAGYIAANTRDGDLTSASVHLREFGNGEWISVNGSQTYAPASMLKIAVMIACLK